MNIYDLALDEAKELAKEGGKELAKVLVEAFGTTQFSRERHPLHGETVVAVLPHGFIHFGRLKDIGGRYMLEDASNLRHWKMRGAGLPEFALKGPIEGDLIDKIGDVYMESVLFFYPAGEWS
ncbi:MAG: hypothetical protein LPH21_12485 [Shewanella sp.]|nr:hypothetical protein [Shewanella sp.]